MKKELTYFRIEGGYGGNQDWFRDPMMHLGGCAAVTACDICIYLALRLGMRELYPFDLKELSRKDYIRFSRIMKPYLRPRMSGIDRLEIYTEGFGAYLNDAFAGRYAAAGKNPACRGLRRAADRSFFRVSGCAGPVDSAGRSGAALSLEEFPGFRPVEDAMEAVRVQIDSNMPAAFLLLKHQEPSLADYVWHWFLLTGYESDGNGFLVKAVTYGGHQWLDFRRLWDTGFDQKGGMVLVQV